MKKKIGYRHIKQFSLIFVLASLLVFCFFAYQSGYLFEVPFSNQYQWKEPSFVFSNEEGTLVIDSSKIKINILDRDYRITGNIRGGMRSDDCFYYAENAIIANNEIYVSDVYYSRGTKVEAERIFRYSLSGKFLGVIFERQYEDDLAPKQYGNIVDMGSENGQSYFLYREENTISVYRIEKDTYHFVRKSESGGLSESGWNYSYSSEDDRIWMTTKTGKIYCENDERTDYDEVKLSGSRFQNMVICDIAAVKSGVYCTDLYNGTLIEVFSQKQLIQPVDPEALGSEIYYRVSSSGDRIATTENTNIRIFNEAGEQIYQSDSAPYVMRFAAICTIGWIGIGLICILVAGLLIFLIKKFYMMNRETRIFKTIVMFVAVIVVAVMITAVNVLLPLFDKIDQLTLSNLMRTIHVISQMNGEVLSGNLKQIDSLDDYNSAAYEEIRSYLDPYCDSAYENNSNMYYVVYMEKNGMLYGVMDYEDTIGVIFPYTRFEGSGYDEVVQTGEIISVSNHKDSYGAWTYVIAPVKDQKNQTVAVLEMGINLYAQEMENKEQIQNIAVAAMAMLLLFILLLTEGSYFTNGLEKRRLLPMEKKPVMIRSLAFISFGASSISVAFMPALSQKLLSAANLGILQSIGTALPISAELFFIAIFSLLGGYLIERLGLRKIMLYSAIIQFGGYLLNAASVVAESYLFLLFSRSLIGCGVGLIVVSFNTMPNREKDEEKRIGLFADLNTGLISGVVFGSAVGAYIAEWAGYETTFLVSALFIIFFAILAYKNILPEKKGFGKEIQKRDSKNMIWFISRRRIYSFLFFVMTPFLVILYFKDYLFPLYAADHAKTESWIGNILLFSGACSIFFGPQLTAWIQKKYKIKTVVISASLLLILPIIVFGLFPGIDMAVLVVFVISIVSTFGLSGQAIYFSDLPEAERNGVIRSMGFYSLWDNASQTAGPILFSALFILGYEKASLIMGIISFAVLFIFLLLTGKKEVQD